MIHGIGMVLPTKYLGSHITRRTTSISRIIGPEGPSNTQISNPDIAFLIQD